MLRNLEYRNSSGLPLWKRGIKGDFKNNFFKKISPDPSLPKRGK
jgi:hypothetical protein